MLRLEEREQAETPKEYRRRVALLCVDVLLARTQVPSEVVNAMREVAQCCGIETVVLASHAVLKAFDAGVRQGREQKRSV